MKTIVTLLGVLFFTVTFSQQNSAKNDIIMTNDGQLLQVKVVKVTEEAISFNYPGESVVNEIRPAKINKIVFASGRTQNFGGGDTTPQKSSNNATVSEELLPEQEFIPEAPNYEEGLLAVVPIDFQRNGAYDKNLASAATKYIIGLMANKASSQGIQVQQMGTAIEKLIDSDFNYSKLKKATPEQLRGALGAEYLMYVTISENEKDAAATTTDFVSETSQNGTQVERNVNIRLYGAVSEVESFEVDFSENVFVSNTTDGSSLLANGKWKSSLRYLTEQLYASRALVD
ncbi:hypothetical protein [Allomuricauda sp. d1]|uniref:hypothetical protein n=1 Tax=Allomuricauda sp. d1 TaxID=3136725 RepID=UPI0031CEB395